MEDKGKVLVRRDKGGNVKWAPDMAALDHGASVADRDRAFACKYIELKFDMIGAAVALGIPQDEAWAYANGKLMKPAVRAFIAEILDTYCATAGEVLYFLTRAMRGEVDGEKVPLDRRIDVAKHLDRTRMLSAHSGRTRTYPDAPGDVYPGAGGKGVARDVGLDYAKLTDEQLEALSEILETLGQKPAG